MNLIWATAENARRKAEEAEVARDGTWDAYAAMKRLWAFRRKQAGLSRTQCRFWLEKAEREAVQ